MSRFRFDGRVAVVTGAGRGIGRAHAMLLAERGASVVVNDLGGSKDGFGSDPEPAQSVVGEITAAGGVAVADTNDVGTVEGCRAMVDGAVKEFGRLDIVINNAGISVWGGPLEADPANLDRTLRVHVGGSFHTTNAAWPHFLEQGFGRVVMTTSTGMFGLPDNLTYATAKGAVIGMARSMTVAAKGTNIKINVLAPAAMTRRGTQKSSIDGAAAAPVQGDYMATELVSPMMAYLAHEACDFSGEILGAGARRFTRLFIAETPGYVHPGESRPTIEDVADHWAEIVDQEGFYVPVDLFDWSAHFMAHRPSG
jgi:NAD(P)-dependent dehydrogenase (short-subunit alcohol dehydrogenase family)